MNETATKVVTNPDKFQPQAVSHLPAVRGAASAAVFVPNDFGGVMEMAKLMSQAGAAVPKHLRQNPGMCLSVAMTAYQNAFNPFLLAADTYVVNDILAYGAKSIGAMVDNSPQLSEPLNLAFEGTWPNRVATVTGRFRGVAEPRIVRIEAVTIQTRNSPLWKSQPDQQLLYYAKRAWARAWMPGVLLGMLGDDEAAERADDITPPRPTRATMHQTTGGFDGDGRAPIDVEPEPEPEIDPVTGEVHERPADDDERPARDVAINVSNEASRFPVIATAQVPNSRAIDWPLYIREAIEASNTLANGDIDGFTAANETNLALLYKQDKLGHKKLADHLTARREAKVSM